MARKPSMAAAVAPRTGAAEAAMTVHQPTAKPNREGSRKGKKGIAFWVQPYAAKQLGQIALDEDRTVQNLMEEALNLLFQSRGKHRLAGSEN